MLEVPVKIKALLEDCDMSRKELAFKAGVSEATIANLLSGRQGDTKLYTLYRMAQALNCDMEINFVNKE